MFKRTVILSFLLFVALLQIGCNRQEVKITPATSPDPKQLNIQALLKTIDDLNTKCRGGSGGSPSTQKACEARDELSKLAIESGWCWGPDDAIGADQRWVKCQPKTVAFPSVEVGKHNWYAASKDDSSCVQFKYSPADMIRMLRSEGKTVQTYDLPDGVVKIGHYISGAEQSWTFYPLMTTCEASLSTSQTVPKKYE
ncbi:MAG: hypothetical protein ABL923_06725 [Burkholderiaceae bacterium]